MKDSWPVRQRVISAMQDVIHAAHKQMDAAQAGQELPPFWDEAVESAELARVLYVVGMEEHGQEP